MTKKNPALVINLQKIRHNAKTVTTFCRKYGVQVAAVTKGFCAIPEVAEAMLEGGCSMLADSRVKNLQKLREARFDVEHMLLREPMISEVEEVVRYADISLNSEIKTIKALNKAAKQHYARHKILLMIDVGDLREGIWLDALGKTVDEIVQCDHIMFEGIGCNVGCYGGVIPTPENMNILLKQKEFIETTYNLKLKLISGGSSCGLQLLASGKMPQGINHFRVGEAVLLGRSTTDCAVIPNTYQNAFIIRGEIVEYNRKPSMPIGQRGRDAFGNIPEFEDKGMRQRAILALGYQDVSINRLTPLDNQIEILGVTSDHLIVDVTNIKQVYQVGDTIEFYPNYGCLLTAASSEYVSKEIVI
jgi:predicted amino acid racemase